MTADRATGLTGALRSHVGSARSDTPLSPRSRWREAGTLFRYQGGRAWGFRLDFCLFFVFSLALACVTQSCRKQVSVQFSPALNRVRPHELQHARLPCPSPTPRSLLKFMSIQWVMLSNHLILCRLLLLPPSVFPSIRVFSVEWVNSSHWVANIVASASASVLPMNIQGGFLLGLTTLISLHPKGLSRAFSSTVIWKPQFFGAQLLYQLSLWFKPLHQNKGGVHEEVSRDRGFYFIICGSHWCDFRSAPHQTHLYDM